MAKNILKILSVFIIGMVGGIFTIQYLLPYLIERSFLKEYEFKQSPFYTIEKKEIIVEENTALKKGIEKVKAAVVGVNSKNQNKTILRGSGLIVTSDGCLVTLADILPKGLVFSFSIENKNFKYQILKRNEINNLALVKVEKTGLSTLDWADQDQIKLGERVFLVAVSEDGLKKTVNEGIIKNFNNNLIETNMLDKQYIQGSPLFNIKREVVGLTFVDSENKVFAIPNSKIRKFLGF